MLLDIDSRSENELAKSLSNLAFHGEFEFGGFVCHSIECPLQACKTSLPQLQRNICQKKPSDIHRLYKKALDADWQRSYRLYRGDRRFSRFSEDHAAYVRDLFNAAFEQCTSYREVVEASIGYDLCHSIGKYDPHKTVLTVPEFLGQLYRLQTNFLR